jgi:DNA mismatch repair protein PMS2
LDANSSRIDISFNDYGTDSIEVSDNGDGIAKNDYESICLRHHTSRINNFESVNNCNFYGFRGEALNSLCVIANVTIITTTTPPLGTLLKFGNFIIIR